MIMLPIRTTKVLAFVVIVTIVIVFVKIMIIHQVVIMTGIDFVFIR